MGQPAPEYVRRQIPTLLAAERALGNDPGVRQGLDRRGDILLTAFANDDIRMNAGCWAVEHENQYRRTLGESFHRISLSAGRQLGTAGPVQGENRKE